MNLVNIKSADIQVDVDTGDVYPFIENYKHYSGQCVVGHVCELPNEFLCKLPESDANKLLDIGEAIVDKLQREHDNFIKGISDERTR